MVVCHNMIEDWNFLIEIQFYVDILTQTLFPLDKDKHNLLVLKNSLVPSSVLYGNPKRNECEAEIFEGHCGKSEIRVEDFATIIFSFPSHRWKGDEQIHSIEESQQNFTLHKVREGYNFDQKKEMG